MEMFYSLIVKLKPCCVGTSTLSSPTIVVSDQTAKPSKTTIGFNTPVVPVNWLKQCVITGNLADPHLFAI